MSRASDPEIYHQTIALDAKLERLIEGVPPFFRLEGGEGNSTAALTEKYPRLANGIVVQRFILIALVHAHRCKLHASFIAQNSPASDPAYGRSRKICLHSARMIIRAENLLEKEEIPFALARLKYCGALYCMFMAVLVLILDLCFNKSENNAQEEETRKSEIMVACDILEKSREHSGLADKLLESLKTVVRKHEVSLPNLENMASNTNGNPNLVAPGSNQVVVEEAQNVPEAHGLSYFDEIWQSFDGGNPQIDVMDWNSLFLELDSQKV